MGGIGTAHAIINSIVLSHGPTAHFNWTRHRMVFSFTLSQDLHHHLIRASGPAIFWWAPLSIGYYHNSLCRKVESDDVKTKRLFKWRLVVRKYQVWPWRWLGLQPRSSFYDNRAQDFRQSEWWKACKVSEGLASVGVKTYNALPCQGHSV